MTWWKKRYVWHETFVGANSWISRILQKRVKRPKRPWKPVWEALRRIWREIVKSWHVAHPRVPLWCQMPHSENTRLNNYPRGGGGGVGLKWICLFPRLVIDLFIWLPLNYGTIFPFLLEIYLQLMLSRRLLKLIYFRRRFPANLLFLFSLLRRICI